MERQTTSQIISEDSIIKKYTILLSLTEISLGSVIHSLHIPLGGHLLSLNQSAICTQCAKEMTTLEKEDLVNPKLDSKNVFTALIEIASISSLLKSLSPAGKKLTPMIAIFAQGVLYAVSIFCFGVNSVGIIIGSILLSLWAFVQSIFIAYITFGIILFENLYKIWTPIKNYLSLEDNHIVWVISGVVILKILICVSINLYIFNTKRSFKINFPHYAHKKKSKDKFLNLNKWFLLGLIINLFIFFAHSNINAESLWIYVLRPIAIIWLIDIVSKILPKKISDYMFKIFPRLRTITEEIRQKIQ